MVVATAAANSWRILPQVALVLVLLGYRKDPILEASWKINKLFVPKLDPALFRSLLSTMPK